MKKFSLKYYAEITGVIVFIVYLTTLSPTVTEFDSGELITVQATLGISHPTGYPLFSIIGYLFSLVPLPISIAYKMNLLCAIWCAATVIVLIKTMKLILDNINAFSIKNITGFSFSQSKYIKIAIAIFTGLVFAFSYTFWSQATKTEVYALQLFLSSLIILYTFKAFLTESDELIHKKKILSKEWLFVSIFVGLGFSNHMMTMYLLPFLFFIFFRKNKFSFEALKKITLLTIISFIISVVFYLYLLLSAKMSSGLNIWLEPNFIDWVNHVRGKMYNVLIIESFGETSKQFKAFTECLMIQLSRESRRGGDFSVNIILIFAGIVLSAFTFRNLFYALMLIILTTFFVSMSYAILDIQEYFLLIFYSFSLFWGFCIYYITSMTKAPVSRLIPITISLFLISVQVLNNYREIDRSDNYVFEDYINAVLDSMDPNTIMITNQWDYIEAPAFYFQIIEGKRSDIEIINLELLTYNTYINSLKQNDKIKYDSAQSSINIYELLNTNNTYVTSEVIRDYLMNYKLFLDQSSYLVPDVLLYKLTKSNDYVPAKDPNFRIRIPKYSSAVDLHILKLVGSMLVNRINYEISYDKVDRAKVYYKKLIEDFPMYSPPGELDFLKEII